MLRGSIVVLSLVGFFSPGQSTTTVAPASVSASATSPQTLNAVQTATMSAMVPTSQTSTSVPPAQATTAVAPEPSSPSATFTSTSMTPPAKPSCASVSFIAKLAWDASLLDGRSALHDNTSAWISKAMKYLYDDPNKYEDVDVFDWKYSQNDNLTLAKVKLCLVVKSSDGIFIEDVFIAKVKTGYLGKGFPVQKGSAGFAPLGVEFKDWKAKEGECADKCEGAGGEFTIERTCVSKNWSCKGLKNTKMTKDCVTYCDSRAGTYRVSVFILAMGIFFSFSY